MRNPDDGSLKQGIPGFSADVVWNVAGLIVFGISGIAINIVILRNHGESALGVFNQAFAIYVVAAQFCTGGIQLSALTQAVPHRDDTWRCGAMVSAALLLSAGLAAVVCALLWVGRSWIGGLFNSEGIARSLTHVVPGLFVFTLNKVYLNVINGLSHMRAFAVFNALRMVLVLAGVILLIALGKDGSTLALSLSLAEGIMFIVLAGYSYTRLFRPVLDGTVIPWIGRHLRFGMKSFFGALFYQINTRVDVLMLGYFTTDAHVGLYSFVALFAEGIGQIAFVLRRIVDPILGGLMARGEREEIPGFARKIQGRIFGGMLVVGVLLVAAYPVGIRVFGIGIDMRASWIILAILVTAVVVNAPYRAFTGILLLGNLPGFQTIFIVAVVLSNVILNAVLIPVLGIYGAAIATAMAYGVEMALIVAFSRKLLGIRL